jgi:hypothetical protein
VVAAPFADIEHSHLGDIELGAKLLLFDAIPSATSRLGHSGIRARAAAAGVVRLGTGQRESPDNFADIGTGDGQTDIEIRGYFDLANGPRLWTSMVARFGMQMADRFLMRVPGTTGEPFPALYRKIEVDRDLGDYFELEVAPRFAPNDAFSLSANYRLRSKQSDRYRGRTNVNVPDELLPTAVQTVDPGILETFSSQTEHRIGWALTYSALRGYANRRSPWPLEVSLVHTQVIAGKGSVLKEFATAVVLRLYRPLMRPDVMRAP